MEPNIRSLWGRFSDPGFIARHGHKPIMFLFALQFLLLPLAVAAIAPEWVGYTRPRWLGSGFAWFAFAFMGNWVVGSGFSVGILFLCWGLSW